MPVRLAVTANEIVKRGGNDRLRRTRGERPSPA